MVISLASNFNVGVFASFMIEITNGRVRLEEAVEEVLQEVEKDIEKEVEKEVVEVKIVKVLKVAEVGKVAKVVVGEVVSHVIQTSST